MKATSLNKVSSSLDQVFAELQKQGQSVLRSTSVNLIILAPHRENLPEVEKLVKLLSDLHPGRFFILVCDETKTEVSAEISSICKVISKNEQICSEVVRLIGPSSSWAALASVVRANVITGLPTELYLVEPVVSKPFLLDSLAPLTDVIMLDSSLFNEDLTQVESLFRHVKSVIDLQWIGSALWRDQIRNVFERPSVAEKICQISEICINASCGREQAIPTVGLLTCGWLIDRLELEPVAYGSEGFECRNSKTSAMVTVKLQPDQSTTSSLINKVHIGFSGASAGHIDIIRSTALETVITLDRSYRLSRPIDDESSIARIQRYFTLGESFTNYRRALSVAMELDLLRRGFLGGLS